MKSFYSFICLFIVLSSFAQTEFITKWDLSLPGLNANEITFGVQTQGNVSYTWETIPAGSSGSGVFSGTTCTVSGLPASSTIRLTIDPVNFQRININSGADANRLISIEQWGTTAWISMNAAFFGCYNLQLNAADVPDLSGVTSMRQMFRFCTALNPPANIDTWNTASVTDMSELFYSDFSFNQSIGSWNTASVTNMSGMFCNAQSFNQNIGSWNTSAVTDMSSLFYSAHTFNQDIGAWNTSAVTNMSYMLGVTQAFNQNIGNWNTSSVTNMNYMFAFTYSFNQDISAWNTSSVTDMNQMFISSTSFNQNISSWNTALVTDMGGMFENAQAFNQDLSTWNISLVTDMSMMFSDAASFNQSLAAWAPGLHDNVNLSQLLYGSGMDCDHYSATLIGWAAEPGIPTGLNLGAMGRTYGTNAVAARNVLTASKGWIITGDVAGTFACSNAVSILENKFSNPIAVYPNPTSGLVNLDLGSLKDVSIKLMNVTGQVLYNEKSNSSFHQVTIEQPAGLYFLELSSGNKTQWYKMIKQ